MAFGDGVAEKIHNWFLGFIADMAETVGLVFTPLVLMRDAAQIQGQADLNILKARNQEVPLSPDILAEMVMRAIKDEASGTEEAAMSAVNAERFKAMVQTVGEPPGLMQMLNLYRRGLITKEWLERAIRYSRVRNEFIGDIENMAHDTMSMSEALEAAVKGVIDKPTAKDLFVMAGGLEDQFQILLDTSGNAIGIQEVEKLWLHGLATSEDVHNVILHSRVNPMFEPLAAKLYHHYLTGFQIRTIVSAGGATPEQATQWLIEEGYPPDQAASFVKAVAHGTAAKVHDITEAQTLELYQSHFISQEEAKTILSHLGYSEQVQVYLLEMTDAKRALTALTQGVTYVRKAYVAGRINDNQALAELGALEVPNAAQTAYIAAWKVEKATEFKTLTEAQVGSAYKKGIISDTDAIGRWVAMGYDTTDAAILLAEHGGALPPGAPAATATP